MPTLTNLISVNRYKSVRIGYDRDEHRFSSIEAQIDDAETDDFYANIQFPAQGEPTYATGISDLNILRTHYAENGGFLKLDGTLIQPEIRGDWKLGTTPESFAQYGFWNPLDADGWENYLQKLEDDGDFSRGVKKRTESDAGTVTLEVGGIKPKRNRSKQANTGVSLERVEASQSGTSIAFTLSIPYDQRLESDDLDDYPELQAFVKWLRSKQPQIQTDIADDFSADASFNNRTITFRQDPDDSASSITLSFNDIFLFGQTIEGTQYVFSYRIRFTRDSGAVISPSDLSGYFEDISVDLTSSDDITEEPAFGARDVRLIGKSVVFPDGAEIFYESGKYWKKVKNANGTIVYIPLQEGSGETMHYEQMPLNSVGRHLVPDFTSPYSAIHFDGSGVGSVWFQYPNIMVRSPETHTSWIIHNRSTLYDLDMFDFNGQLFSVLLPGQLAIVQMTLHDNGNGELSVQRMPTRRYIKQTNSQTFNNRPNWSQGSFIYVLPSMPTTTIGASYDSFTFSSITRSITGANIDSYPDDQFDFKEGVTVKYAGKLDILASWNLDAQGSGGIVNWNGIRVWCKRGTDNPIIVGTNSLPALVAGDERTYTLPAVHKARADDFIFFTHRIDAISGTVNVPQLRVEIDQDPNITILHTAA